MEENQISLLEEYVRDGGTLMIGANAFYVGSVEQANRILNRFGLRILDVEEGDVTVTNFADHPITKDVKRLRLWRPSPVIAESPLARILVPLPGRPANQGFLAISEGPQIGGKVIAFGSSLWWLIFCSICERTFEGLDNPKIFLNTFEYVRCGY